MNDLLDDRQDPGFGIVVSVGANSQIYFLAEGVGSVSCHQSEEGILWSLGHRLGGEAGGR